RTRVLVVVTYRDLEIDRAHPLARTLNELQGDTHFGNVQLGGLTSADVQQLLTDRGLSEAGISIVEAVQHRTLGNPLFVREVARVLRDDWVHAGPRDQPNVDEAVLLSRLPARLRDGISRHLSRLSPATYRLLSAAAVIGREFDLAILEMVAD